jgi:hypothetical protein
VERKIGELKIVSVGPVEARGIIRWMEGFNRLPEGAKALPFKKALNRWPVKVVGTTEFEDKPNAYLDQSLFVKTWSEDDSALMLATFKSCFCKET